MLRQGGEGALLHSQQLVLQLADLHGLRAGGKGGGGRRVGARGEDDGGIGRRGGERVDR